MGVISKRLQQGVFEALASSSKFAGSGGGSGISGAGMQQLAVSGSIGNQNFTSTSLTAITGSSISFHISKPTGVSLQGFVTGKVTAGANNGIFNISITGPNSFSSSNGNCYNGVANFITQYSYLRLYLTVPGVYTALFGAGVDVAGTTFNVPGNSTVLEAVGFGL